MMAREIQKIPLFTLVELLVVIAIIATLIGLSFPVLKNVREKGKKSSCINNLRQIGISVNLYASNNQDYLPICARVGIGPEDPFSMSNVLDTQSKKIFNCPGDTIESYEGKTHFAKYGSSYEWNTFMNGRKIDKTGIGIQNVNLRTPLAGDAENFHGKLSRNYMYPDGSIEGSLKILIE
ncbi:MAG TPA: type II secretion system protein [Victivallales bacterium]|nr:type II secretion system protein [Victivallales bacterium]